MSEYMNINEAAASTGYTSTALYRKVARRQIPYRKHGRRLLFKRSELLEFLEALPGVRIDEVTHIEDR
jgi:excisionase family DNA binding protein